MSLLGKVVMTPLSWAGMVWVFASLGLYVLFQALCGVWFKTQNLKKRYNAQWGLVTGSSSGEIAGEIWGGGQRARGADFGSD